MSFFLRTCFYVACPSLDVVVVVLNKEHLQVDAVIHDM